MRDPIISPNGITVLFMSMRIIIPNRLVRKAHNSLKLINFKEGRRKGTEQKRACALTFLVWHAIFP